MVTNPENTLTFVGILNPAMSILKSTAFSVPLYLKPIVLIGNMLKDTVQHKYYLSTGKLGNDIKNKCTKKPSNLNSNSISNPNLNLIVNPPPLSM